MRSVIVFVCLAIFCIAIWVSDDDKPIHQSHYGMTVGKEFCLAYWSWQFGRSNRYRITEHKLSDLEIKRLRDSWWNIEQQAMKLQEDGISIRSILPLLSQEYDDDDITLLYFSKEKFSQIQIWGMTTKWDGVYQTLSGKPILCTVEVWKIPKEDNTFIDLVVRKFGNLPLVRSLFPELGSKSANMVVNFEDSFDRQKYLEWMTTHGLQAQKKLSIDSEEFIEMLSDPKGLEDFVNNIKKEVAEELAER